MKTKLVTTLLALSLGGAAVLGDVALAGRGDHGVIYDRARVVSVDPVYEEVAVRRPETHCYTREVVVPRRSSATPEIAGAIIGGAIGNQFGGDSEGRAASTVAGVLLGGSIARDLKGGHGGHRVVEERHCDHRPGRERHQRRLVGYDVRYRYAGETLTAFMKQAPGDYVRIRVAVTPVD